MAISCLIRLRQAAGDHASFQNGLTFFVKHKHEAQASGSKPQNHSLARRARIARFPRRYNF